MRLKELGVNIITAYEYGYGDRYLMPEHSPSSSFTETITTTRQHQIPTFFTGITDTPKGQVSVASISVSTAQEINIDLIASECQELLKYPFPLILFIDNRPSIYILGVNHLGLLQITTVPQEDYFVYQMCRSEYMDGVAHREDEINASLAKNMGDIKKLRAHHTGTLGIFKIPAAQVLQLLNSDLLQVPKKDRRLSRVLLANPHIPSIKAHPYTLLHYYQKEQATYFSYTNPLGYSSSQVHDQQLARYFAFCILYTLREQPNKKIINLIGCMKNSTCTDYLISLLRQCCIIIPLQNK